MGFIWILLLAYFVTTPADLLQVSLWIFKFKFTNLISVIVFLLAVFFCRGLYFGRVYVWIFAYLFGCVVISATQSTYPIAMVGFIAFFCFNFGCYFLLPMQLVAFFPKRIVWDVYLISFQVMGSYVMAQVVSSLFGVHLPVMREHIGIIVRGSGFCYEPSYYALYFTPFVMFENARYLMGSQNRVHLGRLIFYNGCYLCSTSTGCFFAYLAFILILFAMRPNALRQILGFVGILGAICIGVFFVFQDIFEMLFKFFYYGISHYSFMERWVGLVRDWNIFLGAPWVGVGLGGVAPYAQQMLYGLNAQLDPESLAAFISTNVTMEALASLGIMGAIGFCALIGRVVFDFRRTLALPQLSEEERIHVTALAISLGVLFFVMQFNQSIMRAYVWVHVGICVAVIHSIRMKYAEPVKGRALQPVRSS